MTTHTAGDGAITAVTFIVASVALILLGITLGTMITDERWTEYRHCLEDHEIEACDKLLNPPGLRSLEK